MAVFVILTIISIILSLHITGAVKEFKEERYVAGGFSVFFSVMSFIAILAVVIGESIKNNHIK